MAKADLLLWVQKHCPPLLSKLVNQNTAYPTFLNDYDRFNAVTSATEAKAALLFRKPPLSSADVDEAMTEYNK